MKKWLQVEIDEALWKAIAHRAVEESRSVSGLVRPLLEVEFGEPAGRPEPENTVRVRRDNAGARPVAGPSNVIQGVCASCEKPSEKLVYNKDKKLICYKCAGF